MKNANKKPLGNKKKLFDEDEHIEIEKNPCSYVSSIAESFLNPNKFKDKKENDPFPFIPFPPTY